MPPWPANPGGHGPAVRHGKPTARDTVPKTHVRDEGSQDPPRTPEAREGCPLWAGGGGIVTVLQGLSLLGPRKQPERPGRAWPSLPRGASHPQPAQPPLRARERGAEAGTTTPRASAS